MNADIAM